MLHFEGVQGYDLLELFIHTAYHSFLVHIHHEHDGGIARQLALEFAYYLPVVLNCLICKVEVN